MRIQLIENMLYNHHTKEGKGVCASHLQGVVKATEGDVGLTLAEASREEALFKIQEECC